MRLFSSMGINIEDFKLPKSFTFPFYYTPHPLAILASEDLQRQLENHKWNHNFGLDNKASGLVIGKMFGVLVVKDKDNNIGYLSAFSGKIDNTNHHKGFVNPVFDLLNENSFFKKEEEIINAINSEIKALENSEEYFHFKEILLQKTEKANTRIKFHKEFYKEQKKKRKERKEKGLNKLSPKDYTLLLETLKKESLGQQAFTKHLTKKLKFIINFHEKKVLDFDTQISDLKRLRKERSNNLQKRIFTEYTFLNAEGKNKSLLSIFSPEIYEIPPSGAGECAAPKLLQYAYLNNLHPICMAEFWWGASPKSQIRKHKNYYPACRSKCEPILGHMLKGLDIDENPIQKTTSLEKNIETLYEDDDILIVNKPNELLSVPGKTIKDSVYTRIANKHPEFTGPIIVHRLDMSTSGIMLLAKNKLAYIELQKQFIKRTVKKRYVALLKGKPQTKNNTIELPLRVDLDNRPSQLVCYEHGKNAKTIWKLVKQKDNITRVHFYPITGRTHQLRVHASHVNGLNCPIIGDDLYGDKGERLFLHAEWLSFSHPTNKKKVEIKCKAPF